MRSFNAYGQTAKEIGGINVPVWLGTVAPIPMGAVYTGDKLDLKAGTPVTYDAMARTFAEASAAANANGYLYNDIHRETETDEATGAIVMHHAEGLLIDCTEYADWATELQAKIPAVLLVRTAAE
jgi:hypothetical protein